MKKNEMIFFIFIFLILFTGCRKEEDLSEPVETLRTYDFSFDEPGGLSGRYMYDLSNGDYLVYSINDDFSVSFKVIDQDNLKVKESHQSASTVIAPNAVWGRVVTNELTPISGNRFVLPTISRTSLDPVNGSSYEYNILNLNFFTDKGVYQSSIQFVIGTAYFNYVSKPKIDFYNGNYYLGYSSTKYISGVYYDSLHVLKLDTAFNLLYDYARVFNTTASYYDTDIAVNNEGIWLAYFDEWYYEDHLVNLEDEGTHMEQVFDKPTSYVPDPYTGFWSNKLIKWNGDLTLIGNSYTPDYRIRSAFVTTNFNLNNLKSGRAVVGQDTTWDQDTYGYAFNSNNDLILFYREYLNNSQSGVVKFATNGTVLSNFQIKLNDLSAFPVHIRQREDGNYTVFGNKRVDGADAWQAFVVIVDDQGNIIH